MDIEELVQTFLALVQIDSVTFEEAAVIDWIGRELTALGLPVCNDRTGRSGAGNLHVQLTGSLSHLPPIMLCAHTDTVEPGRGIRPLVEAGVIRSNGQTILAADNKAAVAAVLQALRMTIRERRPHRDVDLVFTWGEERGHAGSLAFDVTRLKAKIGLTLDDHGAPGTVIVSAPAYCSIHAKFVGRSAHAGAAPEQGVSAIVAAADAILRMQLGRLDVETTANVGLIQGGTARNTVPDLVEIHAEARSRDNAKLDALVRAMEEAMSAGARHRGAAVEAAIKREYPAYRFTEDDPIVREVTAGIRRAGLPPSLGASGGGSDANTFNEKGIQCVNLGIGMQDVHTTKECIRVDDLAATCRIALGLIAGESC
ncbi:MAG TPA: M20/M25/M40 family metallo-hydrolase [Candidatus Sulfotelmatobacter sp.]|nr:M20/M25/M40 family metallo-hydrolase [Candidatus Sulfotelmatobacter sp.]